MTRGKLWPSPAWLTAVGLADQHQTKPSSKTGAGKLVLQTGVWWLSHDTRRGAEPQLGLSRQPGGGTSLAGSCGVAGEWPGMHRAAARLWGRWQCSPQHPAPTAAPSQGSWFLHKPLPWC